MLNILFKFFSFLTGFNSKFCYLIVLTDISDETLEDLKSNLINLIVF